MGIYNFNLTTNTRDLGGYINLDNKEIKYYRFIRSGALNYLNEDDINFLKEHNILTQIDLRAPNATIPLPSCLKNREGFNYYNFALYEASKVHFSVENSTEIYMKMLTHEEVFRDIFKVIMNTKGGIIFSCTAGKDRTGVLAYLLLDLGHIPTEDIIKDYMMTNILLETQLIEINKVIPSFPKDMGLVKEEYIVNFIKAFKDKYIDAKNYLLHLGFKEDEIKIIERKLFDE